MWSNIRSLWKVCTSSGIRILWGTWENIKQIANTIGKLMHYGVVVARVWVWQSMRDLSRGFAMRKLKMYTMLSDWLRHVGRERGKKISKEFAIIRAQTQIGKTFSAPFFFFFFLGLLPMVSSIFSSKKDWSIIELSVKSRD